MKKFKFQKSLSFGIEEKRAEASSVCFLFKTDIWKRYYPKNFGYSIENP